MTRTDAALAAVPSAPAVLRPVFLFSAPRSGSTLVQRVLAAHDGVATTAEPWLLLPLLASQRADLPDSGHWQRLAAGAIAEFSDHLPRGRADVDAALADAARRLYRQAAGPGATHFLDKTPGYVLVIDDIARTFPDAGLLFLWRNPLGVLASLAETFDGGRFRPYRQTLALFDGPVRMVDAYQRHADRAASVRFEDLVTGDPGAWRPLTDAMGIALNEQALREFAEVRLSGSMGDPTGIHRYRALSTEPLDKWRQTLTNPVRRAWARRWLRWLGRERLEVMGYDLGLLLAELDALGGTAVSDLSGGIRDAALLAASAGRDVVMARTEIPTPTTWRRLLSS
ncbi:MAG: sulfotransferase [Solirubrobacteraceae bacterium]|nr:sulfotransferase [Solirubrobacteraceae bacterium]